MSDATYQRFVKKWEQVTELPPQTVGPLTPVYKWLVRKLKIRPWGALGLISFIVVLGMYILVGSTITILTSILQKGF